jgi:serine protease Do
MKLTVYCILLLGCLPSFLGAGERSFYELQLKSGESITAALLFQDKNRVIISLDGEAVQLPRKSIIDIKIKKAESEEAISPEKRALYVHQKTSEYAPLESVVEKTQEAVVTVHTPKGQGSGFFINENGYLVTNVHVIQGETLLSVRQHLKQEGKLTRVTHEKVKIVALAPFYDLALLKVEGEGFPYVPLSHRQDLKRGTSLFAIGNPRGLERSVSSGIASVLDRTFGGIRYLQTTVQVNPGNSGGPLFNLAGEVVGVINMKMMRSEGLGFAIPVFYLKDFLDHHTAYLYDAKNPNSGVRYLPPPDLGF